jgi:hypothetical protein
MTAPAKIDGVNAEVLAKIAECNRRSQECCARKKRYADEWAARAQGTHEMESGQATQQLYVYKCKWCLGHHLTRQQQPRHNAVDYYFKGASK